MAFPENTVNSTGIKYIWDKITALLGGKVDKITGKGLSTNDYTTTEKNKLAGIEAGAQVNPTIDSALSGSSTNAVQNKVVKSALDGKANTGDIPTVNNNTITIQLNGTTIESFTLNQSSNETINIQVKKSDVGLGNVGNFKAVSTVASQGLTDTEKSNARTNIGAGTSSFSGSYTDLSNKPTIPAAANNGTLTIKQNGTSKGTFTANQSGNSEIALTDTTYSSKTAASGGTDVSLVTTGEKYTWNNKSNFSGSYNDLSNKPTIPAAQVQSNWTQTNTSAVDYIKNKPAISDLAFISFPASPSGKVLDDHGGWTDTVAKANLADSATDALHATSADTANSATSAESASKLEGGQKGTNKKPVYINSSGVAVAIDHTIEKNVPSNAVFTDTTTGTTLSYANIANNTTFATNGTVYNLKNALGAAALKAVETTLANDANLPTGSAVISYLNSKIRVVSGTLASSPSAGTIYTETGLSTNYLIIGYTVMNGSTPYQWWYNNVISEIYISGNNLVVKHTASAINSRTIYVFLYRIN